MPMPSQYARYLKAIRTAVQMAKKKRQHYLKISDVFPRSDTALSGLRRDLLAACQSGDLNRAGLEVCFDSGHRGMEWSFRFLGRGVKVRNQFDAE